MNTEALMVFAKAPEPGRVKTRLGWPGELAARVHAAFVLDVIQRHSGPRRSLTLWTAGDAHHPFWTRCGPVERTPQMGPQLGARMENAFRYTLKNHTRVVVVGTDSPTLPVEYVNQAFQALDTHEVVIGPAEDGGYVLLGMRQTVFPLFPVDMPWGQPTVLEKTLDILKDQMIDYVLLDTWYDVDRPEDAIRLHQELSRLDARSDAYPVHTMNVLREVYDQGGVP